MVQSGDEYVCGKDKIGSEVPPPSLRLARQLPIPPLPLNQFFERLVLALAVLESVHPISLIVFAVSVSHGAPPFPPALLVAALILVAVGPAVLPLAILLILAPLAGVCFPSVGVHGGLAFQLIVPEISLEHAPLLHQHSSSVLLIVQELASVCTPVGKASCALAVGLVILPLSLVGVPGGVGVPSVAISHAVSEIAFIEAPVRLDETALALAVAALELALQVVSVVELQKAGAVGLSVQKLSLKVGSQSVHVDSSSVLRVLGGLGEGGELLEAGLDSFG
jgi:hypothetical protein